ncbi:hypothetical protein OU995_18740 [Roseateles sp. SL47]|uniref:hypothetical protein n=1 Tax=Roseateles sp. SL47 TaxID=2995138 RepID=UPI002270A8BF|nr:hypothetical protein [Roseateles sp. SL47]WAC71609.1 hypothetical protein OU995_18740 [Roseateles sp. SL47]
MIPTLHAVPGLLPHATSLASGCTSGAAATPDSPDSPASRFQALMQAGPSPEGALTSAGDGNCYSPMTTEQLQQVQQARQAREQAQAQARAQAQALDSQVLSGLVGSTGLGGGGDQASDDE